MSACATGAAIGMTVGGPVGGIVAGVLGAVVGGLGGSALAEVVDPTEVDGTEAKFEPAQNRAAGVYEAQTGAGISSVDEPVTHNSASAFVEDSSGSEKYHTPTHEEIAARAWSYYEAEGRSDGNDWRHWFQAESDLRGERY